MMGKATCPIADGRRTNIEKKLLGATATCVYMASDVVLFYIFSKLNVNTFGRDLELAALYNLDNVNGLVTGGGGGVLDLLDDFEPLEDLAEDDVATIEPAIGWAGHMLADVSCEGNTRRGKLTR